MLQILRFPVKKKWKQAWFYCLQVKYLPSKVKTRRDPDTRGKCSVHPWQTGGEFDPEDTLMIGDVRHFKLLPVLMNPNVHNTWHRHACALAPTAHKRHERAGDAVPQNRPTEVWEQHLCKEANQHQRTKPQPLHKGRGPGPVCAEPFPGRCASHCNAIKHTLILLLSYSHSPLLLPGKDRASSHAALQAAKKSKKLLNSLYHLRCKTFLLGLKCGDKYFESSWAYV